VSEAIPTAVEVLELLRDGDPTTAQLRAALATAVQGLGELGPSVDPGRFAAEVLDGVKVSLAAPGSAPRLRRAS